MKLLGWQGAVDDHGRVSVGLRVYFSCSSVCGEREKRTLFKLPLHPADPYGLAMLFPDIHSKIPQWPDIRSTSYNSGHCGKPALASKECSHRRAECEETLPNKNIRTPSRYDGMGWIVIKRESLICILPYVNKCRGDQQQKWMVFVWGNRSSEGQIRAGCW